MPPKQSRREEPNSNERGVNFNGSTNARLPSIGTLLASAHGSPTTTGRDDSGDEADSETSELAEPSASAQASPYAAATNGATTSQHANSSIPYRVADPATSRSLSRVNNDASTATSAQSSPLIPPRPLGPSRPLSPIPPRLFETQHTFMKRGLSPESALVRQEALRGSVPESLLSPSGSSGMASDSDGLVMPPSRSLAWQRARDHPPSRSPVQRARDTTPSPLDLGPGRNTVRSPSPHLVHCPRALEAFARLRKYAVLRDAIAAQLIADYEQRKDNHEQGQMYAFKELEPSRQTMGQPYAMPSHYAERAVTYVERHRKTRGRFLLHAEDNHELVIPVVCLQPAPHLGDGTLYTTKRVAQNVFKLDNAESAELDSRTNLHAINRWAISVPPTPWRVKASESNGEVPPPASTRIQYADPPQAEPKPRSASGPPRAEYKDGDGGASSGGASSGAQTSQHSLRTASERSQSLNTAPAAPYQASLPRKTGRSASDNMRRPAVPPPDYTTYATRLSMPPEMGVAIFLASDTDATSDTICVELRCAVKAIMLRLGLAACVDDLALVTAREHAKAAYRCVTGNDIAGEMSPRCDDAPAGLQFGGAPFAEVGEQLASLRSPAVQRRIDEWKAQERMPLSSRGYTQIAEKDAQPGQDGKDSLYSGSELERGPALKFTV